MPLGEGWVDEAIAMLDELEATRPPTPTEVLATQDTVQNPAPPPPVPDPAPGPALSHAPAPLSYVGEIRPFSPAVVCWRPRTRA